jgi:aarF domain-containing kinase
LNQNEKTEDEGERNISLKACHQRCADRTLKVLEKNGSIFIKLGQHLVSGMLLRLLIISNGDIRVQ